jgi:DNA-binding MarR family transcriptional regulator
LSALLSQADRRLTRRLADELDGEGVTVEEARTLELLADGSAHSMSEVADAVALPGPTLTRLVDRLVIEGLIYRKADDHDRRRVLVYATTRGLGLHKRVKRRLGKSENCILAALTDAGAEQLIDQLTELVAKLDGERD